MGAPISNTNFKENSPTRKGESESRSNPLVSSLLVFMVIGIAVGILLLASDKIRKKLQLKKNQTEQEMPKEPEQEKPQETQQETEQEAVKEPQRSEIEQKMDSLEKIKVD